VAWPATVTAASDDSSDRVGGLGDAGEACVDAVGETVDGGAAGGAGAGKDAVPPGWEGWAVEPVGEDGVAGCSAAAVLGGTAAGVGGSGWTGGACWAWSGAGACGRRLPRRKGFANFLKGDMGS
jgi:hypothetical protein